jgi:hypothetical protein
MTRTRESSLASRARIAPVESVERSSTTTISSAGHVCARNARTVRSIDRSSSRAGMITETSGV